MLNLNRLLGRTVSVRRQRCIVGGRAEACEPRLLLTGNVTAEFADNSLQLTGDKQANEVVVLFEGGLLLVRGRNATTVNGQAEFIVTNSSTISGNLTADLGGGNDVLLIKDISVSGTITIDGGAGHDRLAVASGSSGALTIRPGDGNDETLINSANISGALAIQDDKGKDLVMAGMMGTAASVSIVTGKGNDIIFVQSSAPVQNIDLGAGKDSLAGISSGGPADFNLGSGNDLGAIANMGAGTAELRGDTGNDFLFVGSLDASTQLTADGGTGNDSLFVQFENEMPEGFSEANIENHLAALIDIPQKVLSALQLIQTRGLLLAQFFQVLVTP